MDRPPTVVLSLRTACVLLMSFEVVRRRREDRIESILGRGGGRGLEMGLLP